VIRDPLRLACALALAALLGCAAEGATANFHGVRNPVLLGPKDRVNVEQASPATKVSDFKSTAYKMTTSHDSGGYTYTNTRWTGDGKLAAAARRALAGDDTLDLRLKEVEGTAWVMALGAGEKTQVHVEGEVVSAGVK
jgi:hypothetical protein